MARTDEKKPRTVVIQPQNFFDSVKTALFIIGTSLLVFAAARNSITWQIQRFWGASGSFWQRHWDNIYGFYGKNDYLIGFVGTLVFTNCLFWVGNAVLLCLDLTGYPQFLQKYKIQEDKNVPLDMGKFKRTLLYVVLVSQFLVGVPFVYCLFFAFKWRGCEFGGELPTFQWVLIEFFVFTLVEEFGFYYSHRLFHHPLLYKHIHKRHHEWTAPIGISSIYAHPLEHIMSNMIPISMGPLIMGSHLSTTWLWYGLALLSTTIAHSGYHFPLLPSPEAHDYHHLKFNQNFGVMGILDRLHGTDANFRKTPQYERHILLLSLVPLTTQIPDSPKHKSLKSE